ncbi:unnamed protein product [Camellia sinensis]
MVSISPIDKSRKKMTRAMSEIDLKELSVSKRRPLLSVIAVEEEEEREEGFDSRSDSLDRVLFLGSGLDEIVVDEECDVVGISLKDEKYCVEDCGWPLKEFAYECKINLLTGRTHQIRAQLAACGAPIVGDSMYMPAAIVEMISPGLNPFGKYKKQCTSEYDKAMAMQEWISYDSDQKLHGNWHKDGRAHQEIKTLRRVTPFAMLSHAAIGIRGSTLLLFWEMMSRNRFNERRIVLASEREDDLLREFMKRQRIGH